MNIISKLAILFFIFSHIACYKPLADSVNSSNIIIDAADGELTTEVSISLSTKEKSCTSDHECIEIITDCCGNKESSLIVNKRYFNSIQSRVKTMCMSLLQKNSNLCQGIKHESHSKTIPVCENNVCALKKPQELGTVATLNILEQHSICQGDYDCVLMDLSCCNDKQQENIRAINQGSGYIMQRSKNNFCRKIDKHSACKDKKWSSSFSKLKAICTNNHCQIHDSSAPKEPGVDTGSGDNSTVTPDQPSTN